MSVFGIVKISFGVLAVIVLAVVLLFADFVQSYSEKYGENALEQFNTISSHKTQGNLPGVQAMQQAREFLVLGEYGDAREKLLFVVNFYGDAPFAPVARQILGEMNIDQLFLPSNLNRKKTYQVKPGDSLSKIANAHETSIENIMALNSLSYKNRIQPGQELVVMPLTFKIVIDVPNKIMMLKDGGTFIKEYPLKSVVLNTRKRVLSLKVSKLMAHRDGMTYSRVSSQYMFNSKLITLNMSGLQIRAVAHPDDPDSGSGFFLTEADMEEFALLVKSGNEVEIRL